MVALDRSQRGRSTWARAAAFRASVASLLLMLVLAPSRAGAEQIPVEIPQLGLFEMLEPPPADPLRPPQVVERLEQIGRGSFEEDRAELIQLFEREQERELSGARALLAFARAVNVLAKGNDDQELTLMLVQVFGRARPLDDLHRYALETVAMAIGRRPDQLALRFLESLAVASSVDPELQRMARAALVARNEPRAAALNPPDAPIDWGPGSSGRSTPLTKLEVDPSAPLDQLSQAFRGGALWTAAYLAERLPLGVSGMESEAAASPRLATLFSWLEDSEPYLRLPTARGLGVRLTRLGYGKTYGAIVRALAQRYGIEPDARVRRALLVALGRSRYAFPERAEALRTAEQLDVDPWCRWLAALAGGGIFLTTLPPHRDDDTTRGSSSPPPSAGGSEPGTRPSIQPDTLPSARGRSQRSPERILEGAARPGFALDGTPCLTPLPCRVLPPWVSGYVATPGQGSSRSAGARLPTSR